MSTTPGETEGGGASRTTEPAHGSSSATDVALIEHLSFKVSALDRHLTSELASLRREMNVANRTAEKAIEVAAGEAKERLAAHNGLIEHNRAREEQNQRAAAAAAATYATRESLDDYKQVADVRVSKVEAWQARLTGGIFLLAMIGIANLVKVWGG